MKSRILWNTQYTQFVQALGGVIRLSVSASLRRGTAMGTWCLMALPHYGVDSVHNSLFKFIGDIPSQAR
jgi:hypothetical protein